MTIIRQPYGPDMTRNFKVWHYNIYPTIVNESDWVVPQAYIPKKYTFKTTLIGKSDDNIFTLYDVYLTEDNIINFYDKNKLSHMIDLNNNYKIKFMKINKKLYIIFDLYRSRMYQIKDINVYKKLNEFIKKTNLYDFI